MGAPYGILGIRNPTENENPYWDAVAERMDDIDKWMASCYEDKDLIIHGGAPFELVGDTFSWGTDIHIESLRGNSKLTILAGSETVNDGENLYIDTPGRLITSDAEVTLNVSSDGLLLNYDRIAIGKRVGSSVIINGLQTSAIGLPTFDDIYNNQSGVHTVSVDNGDMLWNLSGENSFIIDLAGITGTVDGVQVINGADYLKLVRTATDNISFDAQLDALSIIANGDAALSSADGFTFDSENEGFDFTAETGYIFTANTEGFHFEASTDIEFISENFNITSNEANTINSSGLLSMESSNFDIVSTDDESGKSTINGVSGLDLLSSGTLLVQGANVQIRSETEGMIDFQCFNSSVIPFNESGSSNLSGFTATSLIGSLNELKSEQSQYALLVGRSGGQSLYGGTASGDDLYLYSSSNATKGNIYLGANSFYDEVNKRLGLNVTPTAILHAKGTTDDSLAYAVKIDNSTPANLFSIRNDGLVSVGSILNISSGGYLKYNDAQFAMADTAIFSYYTCGAGNLTATGTKNTGAGYESLLSVTTGQQNSAFGYRSMKANLDGSYNCAFGTSALDANTSGERNSIFGFAAAHGNIDGDQNTIAGFNALYNSISGNNNTAYGYKALNLSTSSNNIAIGWQAGDNITTGGNNIIIGHDANAPSATADNQLNLGDVLLGDVSTGGFAFSGGTVGVAQTGYTTFANLSVDRTCDADTVAVAELADIVGTMIEDLKIKGIIAA